MCVDVFSKTSASPLHDLERMQGMFIDGVFDLTHYGFFLMQSACQNAWLSGIISLTTKQQLLDVPYVVPWCNKNGIPLLIYGIL